MTAEDEEDGAEEPWRSGPLQKTIRLGAAAGDYVVRLYWRAHEDGSVLWVDFDAIQIVGIERGGDGDREIYSRRGSDASPDPVYSLDEAELAVHGFVKFDGCTQFRLGSSRDGGLVHVDSLGEIERLFEAIRAARYQAAQAMPGTIVHETYGSHDER